MLKPIFDLMPAAWRPYAKAIVAAFGAVLSILVLVLPDAPDWIAAVVNVATVVGVYHAPDSDGDGVPDEIDSAPEDPSVA